MSDEEDTSNESDGTHNDSDGNHNEFDGNLVQGFIVEQIQKLAKLFTRSTIMVKVTRL